MFKCHCFSRPCLFIACLLVLLILGGAPSTVRAAGFSYDESIHGDLSDDRLNPTVLQLGAGVNSLSATIGENEDFSIDLDYLRIELAPNLQLDQIIMKSFSVEFDGVAFIAIQSGPIFTVDPSTASTNIDQLLGWSHFGADGPSPVGSDIMGDMGTSFGAIGFTGPLKGDSFTFWMQQLSSTNTFELEFIASAVPEPMGATALLAFLLIGLSARHRSSPTER